jgi:hypothetical protein
MALVIRAKRTAEQKDKILTNVINRLAANPGGTNRQQALAFLTNMGFTLQEIQDKVQALTTSNLIEVVDDGK